MRASHSRQALLDAAETLFAERGFAATSIREITRRAGMNVASASYHFGGKRGLMEAVLERRVRPLNQRRLSELDAVEAATRGRRMPLERVLEAFMGPALRMAEQGSGGGEAFLRLMGRTFIEPDAELQAFFTNLFQDVARRFIPAVRCAVPGLPATDLFWRLHFMIGCMAQTMGDKERLRTISRGRVDPNDTEDAIRQLVGFVAGGFRAPARSRRTRRKR